MLSVKDIAMELEGREYYACVAWEFIVEAVEHAIEDLGIVACEENISVIDKYIRRELI